MQQKLLQFFLPQEPGASGNNIVQKPQKPRPNLKKHILCSYREYLLCLQSNASSKFLQKCINFVDFLQILLNFSHFKGSIIP